jgi:HNH endonuclease
MASRVARVRASRMQAQAGCCYYCAQPMWTDSDEAFRGQFNMTTRRAALFQCTAEHLRPRCEGGATSAANIVAACRFCNMTRHRARKPKQPAAFRVFVQRRLAKGRWQRVHGADLPPPGRGKPSTAAIPGCAPRRSH